MIRHPDVGLMPDADIDRNQIAAECHDVRRQSTDAHAKLDGAAMRGAGVGAQRNDTFDIRQVEHTPRRVFLHLRRLLVDQTMMSHLPNTFWETIGLSIP